VCGVAVNREVEELDTELARELRGRSPTVHAGVVIDRHAFPNGEVDAHALGMSLSATPASPSTHRLIVSTLAGRRGVVASSACGTQPNPARSSTSIAPTLALTSGTRLAPCASCRSTAEPPGGDMASAHIDPVGGHAAAGASARRAARSSASVGVTTPIIRALISTAARVSSSMAGRKAVRAFP
jgi:hypothetical protein